jgi:hypothetical protein
MESVINVTNSRGPSMTSWKALTAQGVASSLPRQNVSARTARN